MSDEPRTKAERLALAAAVAPSVRDSAERPRRVALIDADGNVTGYTDVSSVQRTILERAKIELDVGPNGARLCCQVCGRMAKRRGPRSTRCDRCERRRCDDCGDALAASRGKPGQYVAKDGFVLCRSCRKLRTKPNQCAVCKATFKGTRRAPGARCQLCRKVALAAKVWLCTLCGEPCSNRATRCRSCALRAGDCGRRPKNRDTVTITPALDGPGGALFCSAVGHNSTAGDTEPTPKDGNG